VKVVKVCALAALLVSLAGCGASSGAPPTRMDTIVDEAAVLRMSGNVRRSRR